MSPSDGVGMFGIVTAMERKFRNFGLPRWVGEMIGKRLLRNPEPRRGRTFGFLFLDTLAPIRLNGPYFAPRGLPGFALLAVFLFHCRAKSADPESRLRTVWQLDFERARG